MFFPLRIAHGTYRASTQPFLNANFMERMRTFTCKYNGVILNRGLMIIIISYSRNPKTLIIRRIIKKISNFLNNNNFKVFLKIFWLITLSYFSYDYASFYLIFMMMQLLLFQLPCYILQLFFAFIRKLFKHKVLGNLYGRNQYSIHLD